jgi:hypothetical protein
MDIHCSSCCPKKKAEKASAIGKEHQDIFLISGYCCGMSLTRDGTSGVAEPQMKPGIMQKAAVLNGYVMLTNFILKTPVKWTDRNGRLFTMSTIQTDKKDLLQKSIRIMYSSVCGPRGPTWNRNVAATMIIICTTLSINHYERSLECR